MTSHNNAFSSSSTPAQWLTPSAKPSVAAHPALGIGQTTTLPGVLFSGRNSDAAQLTQSLPNVSDPSMTVKEAERLIREEEKKRFPTLKDWNLLKEAWFHFTFKQKIRRKERHTLDVESLKYLPDENQKRLKRYKRWFYEGSNYYLDKWFGKKGKAMRKSAAIQGPIAVKTKQAYYQSQKSILRENKVALEFLSDRAKVNDTLKTLNVNPVLRFFYVNVLRHVGKLFAKREIKEIEQYKELLGNLPIFDKKQTQANLNTMVEAYNARHTDNPIEGQPELLKSGSVGIAYKATLKNGEGNEKYRIIKIIRPELSPDTISDFKNYLYFINLCYRGTKPQQKQDALEDALIRISFLKRELQPETELQNIQDFRTDFAPTSIESFTTTKPYYANEHGLVTSYDGDTTFGHLSVSQQAKALDGKRLDLLTMPERMSIIHADLHDDNAMVNGETQLTLIDFGRVIRLNPEIHRAIINLSTLNMALAKNERFSLIEETEHLVRDKRALPYLETILKGSPYEQDLDKIKAWHDAAGRPDTETRTAIERVVKVCETFLYENHALFSEKEFDKEAIKKSAENKSIYRVLYPWYNYIGYNNTSAPEQRLASLAIDDVPISELKDIRTKILGFYSAMFAGMTDRISDDDKKEVVQKVMALTTDTLESLPKTARDHILDMGYFETNEKWDLFRKDFDTHLNYLKSHDKLKECFSYHKVDNPEEFLTRLKDKTWKELKEHHSKLYSFLSTPEFISEADRLKQYQERFQSDEEEQTALIHSITQELLMETTALGWADTRLELEGAPQLSTGENAVLKREMKDLVKHEFTPPRSPFAKF